MDKTRILIVDDDELVTMSLEMILGADSDFQVAGKGNSGSEAVELYKKIKPDVLIMDIRMPDMTGVDAAEIILREDRDAVILFLTTFKDDEYIIKALQLGAKGYLLKQDYKSIPDAIKAVVKGQNVFGGEIVSRMPEIMAGKMAAGGGDKAGQNPGEDAMTSTDGESSSLAGQDEADFAQAFDYEAAGITPKEYEVIQLVASGLSNKEIADRIFLSEGTVKNYISTILDKLELRDRTQLAIFYLKKQI